MSSTPTDQPPASTTELADNVSGVMDKAKSNVGSIVVILLGTAALALLIAYFLYWMINSYTIDKKSVIIPQTKSPIIGTAMTKINGVTSPVSTNGKRYTITFWVYVHDFDKYRGAMRHVLHIGDEDVASASPFVYFGPNDNKMYVGFNPNVVDTTMGTPGTGGATTLSVCNNIVNKYGIVIDYIPSQRWVHVAIVVNEDTNGGSISAYVDGDLAKVVTTGGSNVPGQTLSLYNLNITKSGVLIIGGSTNDSVGPGFSGLVSGVRLFNYDLNINDVYNVYKMGPIDNLLAKLGLPAYGVRSPVYRL